MKFLHRVAAESEHLISNLDLKDFLLLTILFLTLSSLFFFFATLFKRIRKIGQEKIKKKYQEEIDRILFEIMFDTTSSTDSAGFSVSGNSELFNIVMIKSLIGLNSNYSGAYNDKLEDFYVKSGLVKYSLEKLRSNKWVDVVEGMRDISAMNYKKAYGQIARVEFEKNDMVQQEKLIAKIRLKGLQELWEFMGSKTYFNDWTQSNILFSIKRYKVSPVDNLPELLHSQNESVALLGIRLIHYYQNLAHLQILEEFKKITKSQKLIDEINFLLYKKSYSRV